MTTEGKPHPLAGSGLEQFAKPPDTLEGLLDNDLHAVDLGERFEGKPLHLRLLSTAETARARIAASKHLLAAGFERVDLLEETGKDLFDLEVMVQILALALVRPPASQGLPPTAYAKDANHLRDRLRPAEVEALYREYVWFKVERAPLERMESWDEARAYAEGLASGKVSREPMSLQRFDVGSLKRILLALADLATKRTRPSSSDTSPPSSSADDSSATAGSTLAP